MMNYENRQGWKDCKLGKAIEIVRGGMTGRISFLAGESYYNIEGWTCLSAASYTEESSGNQAKCLSIACWAKYP